MAPYEAPTSKDLVGRDHFAWMPSSSQSLNTSLALIRTAEPDYHLLQPNFNLNYANLSRDVMNTTENVQLPNRFDRRTWVALTSVQLCGLSLFKDSMKSAIGDEIAAPSKVAPLNRYPRMLHNWYVGQVQSSELRNIQAIESLNTTDDALRYVSDVQRKIRQCFGPEPERTPLNARVTGTLERDGYRVEKIIFDSRPNFPVTANLYIPTTASGPFPAVVGTCGHSFNGKAAEAYQSFA